MYRRESPARREQRTASPNQGQENNQREQGGNFFKPSIGGRPFCINRLRPGCQLFRYCSRSGHEIDLNVRVLIFVMENSTTISNPSPQELNIIYCSNSFRQLIRYSLISASKNSKRSHQFLQVWLGFPYLIGWHIYFHRLHKPNNRCDRPLPRSCRSPNDVFLQHL